MRRVRLKVVHDRSLVAAWLRAETLRSGHRRGPPGQADRPLLRAFSNQDAISACRHSRCGGTGPRRLGRGASKSRIGFPDGGSILITAAPISTSIRLPSGPGIYCDRFRTRTHSRKLPIGLLIAPPPFVSGRRVSAYRSPSMARQRPHAADAAVCRQINIPCNAPEPGRFQS